MNSMKCETKPGCIKAALEILGDKWSPLILKELAERDSLRFGEIESALGLSPRTLTQRLEHLEAEGVIIARQYCAKPPRNAYELTQKGVDLVDVVVAMGTWGAKYSRSTVDAHLA
jgi:DNA-binding HxlR family transcriptional regulator